MKNLMERLFSIGLLIISVVLWIIAIYIMVRE